MTYPIVDSVYASNLTQYSTASAVQKRKASKSYNSFDAVMQQYLNETDSSEDLCLKQAVDTGHMLYYFRT